MPEPLTSPLLTAAQVGRLCGLSVWMIYRLVEGKQLSHYRLGQGTHGRIRFSQTEIDAWLQGQHIQAKDETRRLMRKQP